MQDSLAHARAKLELHREGMDVRAWLFTVMHDICVNRMPARHAAEPVEEEVDLERALGRLTVEQRAVLLLVTLEDMSYADVARTLGIPEDTVISRLSVARARLRGLMSGEGKLKLVK